MIRLAIAYLGVVVLLCAAIVMGPLAWIQGDHDAPVAEAEALPPAARDLALAQQEPAPAPAADVAAPAPEGSTAQLLASAIAASQAAEVAAATQQPAPSRLIVDNSDLNSTTQDILAQLRNEAGQAPGVRAQASDDAMMQMSANALSGLRALRDGAGGSDLSLQSLVVQALREGQSDAYIDALVNEAAGQGAVSVPAMLVTAEGRVDTAVLLASLVARSTEAEFGEGDISDPTADLATPEVIFDRDQLYTVQPGDSLGAIALRFYGDAGKFPAIFNANRATLIAPDQIRTGQRLTIPAPGRL